MGNRTARFISTLVASIVAGAPLAAVSQNAPTAATAPTAANSTGDCLASPKGIAPQGQHWYYRLERSTKRQCWYLRAEGAKATQSTQATAAAPDTDSTAPQTVQNAHAEYIAPQTGAAASRPNMATPAPAAAPATAQQPPGTSDGKAQQTDLGARWPDTSTTAALPAPQPAPAPAPAATDAQPSAQQAPAVPAPPAQAAADAPVDKPTGSLQMLLLVVVGALAIAGLIASIIYRFAGSRVQVQANDGPRRVNWDNREPQNSDNNRAPWLDGALASASRPQTRRPVDFDIARLSSTRLTSTRLTAVKADLDAQPARDDAAPDHLDEDMIEAIEVEAPVSRLAAVDTSAEDAEEPADADTVDVDAITAILERLAKEGPRLAQPKPEAGLADSARTQRGQSAARA
ncbi:hypothetical protein [Bradyrhizobium sp.]|uniref:hypothetical protein n=1 Tax=Bradyrhizobium sp. TaxID=376 RepID=UPI0039E24263